MPCPAMYHISGGITGKAEQGLMFGAAFRSRFTNLPLLVDPHHIEPVTATALGLLQTCLNAVLSLAFTTVDLKSFTWMVLER